MEPGPLDGLPVQALRAFCLVYERGNFSAAARALGLSVPAVWSQVQAVARRYRTILFARRGRRMEPTPAAQTLYEALRPLLVGMDSTLELVRDAQGIQARTLTLVTGARLMLEDLGPPLAQFSRLYPQIRLRLVHAQDRQAVHMVAAGEADLALTLQPPIEGSVPPVTAMPAFSLEYMAVFPRRHPLARQPRVRLHDLVRFPLVLGVPGAYGRRVVEQALCRLGLQELPTIVAEADNGAFITACVRAGMGVGILAGQLRGFLCRDLATRSLASELGSACIVFLIRRGRIPSPPMQTLLDLIRHRKTSLQKQHGPKDRDRGPAPGGH